MREIVKAQGGDTRAVDEPDRLKLARYRRTVTAPADGFVTNIDPLELGYASMQLGAGRLRAQDEVDPGAGIRLHVGLGHQVRAGDDLATLHTSKRALLDRGSKRVEAAFQLGRRRRAARSRIIETIRG